MFKSRFLLLRAYMFNNSKFYNAVTGFWCQVLSINVRTFLRETIPLMDGFFRVLPIHSAHYSFFSTTTCEQESNVGIFEPDRRLNSQHPHR
ncbi:hypothetical protein X801_06564 [Opisthorchis viverrini]|uniref:Uncharacterized protein n=1 Tax=Opisthorchis viverrini TaxID=6198 RepID=A0A1S8WT85_OPIVI|nr:hypothetical protein X801_06564 [Opisthorchis viverrini]